MHLHGDGLFYSDDKRTMIVTLEEGEVYNGIPSYCTMLSARYERVDSVDPSEGIDVDLNLLLNFRDNPKNEFGVRVSNAFLGGNPAPVFPKRLVRESKV